MTEDDREGPQLRPRGQLAGLRQDQRPSGPGSRAPCLRPAPPPNAPLQGELPRAGKEAFHTRERTSIVKPPTPTQTQWDTAH